KKPAPSHRHTLVKRLATKSPPEHQTSAPLKTDERTPHTKPVQRQKVVHLPEPAAARPAGTIVPRELVPEKDRGSYDGDTAIKLYLREIGLVALLTPEQEIELAAKI